MVVSEGENRWRYGEKQDEVFSPGRSVAPVEQQEKKIPCNKLDCALCGPGFSRHMQLHKKKESLERHLPAQANQLPFSRRNQVLSSESDWREGPRGKGGGRKEGRGHTHPDAQTNFSRRQEWRVASKREVTGEMEVL